MSIIQCLTNSVDLITNKNLCFLNQNTVRVLRIYIHVKFAAISFIPSHQKLMGYQAFFHFQYPVRYQIQSPVRPNIWCIRSIWISVARYPIKYLFGPLSRINNPIHMIGLLNGIHPSKNGISPSKNGISPSKNGIYPSKMKSPPPKMASPPSKNVISPFKNGIYPSKNGISTPLKRHPPSKNGYKTNIISYQIKAMKAAVCFEPAVLRILNWVLCLDPVQV